MDLLYIYAEEMHIFYFCRVYNIIVVQYICTVYIEVVYTFSTGVAYFIFDFKYVTFEIETYLKR